MGVWGWQGGGFWGVPPPLGFIFNFYKMKNGVFSYYTCSWDALHLFQSSCTIIMWRGKWGGGLGTCPPPSVFKKVFANWLNGDFSHYICAWDALYLFQSSVIIFTRGQGGLGACPPPRFFFLIYQMKSGVFLYYTCSWHALYLFWWYHFDMAVEGGSKLSNWGLGP